MSIVTEDELKKMSEENKKSYCEWCFYKDYGDCSKCAIEKERSGQIYLTNNRS